MIRRGINPEIVRRQLRHKSIETTMKIYVQINEHDLQNSVPIRPDVFQVSLQEQVNTPYLRVVR
jgi:hypothetical protein